MSQFTQILVELVLCPWTLTGGAFGSITSKLIFKAPSKKWKRNGPRRPSNWGKNALNEKNKKTITHLTSIEQTDKMVYLGGLLTADWRCEKEVKRTIALAKSAFHEMSRVLKSRNTNMQTRQRILLCYIRSKLLYDCETSTLAKTMESKLEAF